MKAFAWTLRASTWCKGASFKITPCFCHHISQKVFRLYKIRLPLFLFGMIGHSSGLGYLSKRAPVQANWQKPGHSQRPRPVIQQLPQQKIALWRVGKIKRGSWEKHVPPNRQFIAGGDWATWLWSRGNGAAASPTNLIWTKTSSLKPFWHIMLSGQTCMSSCTWPGGSSTQKALRTRRAASTQASNMS